MICIKAEHSGIELPPSEFHQSIVSLLKIQIRGERGLRLKKEYWSHLSLSRTRSAISPVSPFIKFEGTSLLAYVNEIQRSHVNQRGGDLEGAAERNSFPLQGGCLCRSEFSHVKGIKAILLSPLKKDRCTNVGNQIGFKREHHWEPGR